MPFRTLIVISGTVIASAVAVLLAFAPGASTSTKLTQPTVNITEAPLARKGDKLRVLGEHCTGLVLTAACADIYGAPGPRPTITIERRIGESTTAFIRMPVSQVASR